MSNSADENLNPGLHRPAPIRSDQHYDHSAGGLGTPPTWLAPNKIASSDFNSAYTDFSASLTLTSSGTAPALGNAVIVAKYKKVGKFVHYYGKITFGSTSTFGSGTLVISLPATAISTIPSNISIGTVYALDSSASAFAMGNPIPSGTTGFNMQQPATWPSGVQSVWAAAVPWTWATSDSIAWNVMYEAA